MAEEKQNKKKKNSNSLVGARTEPTVLEDSGKLGIDTEKTVINNIINAGLTGGLNITEIENFTSISNSRAQLYQLIDTMAADSAVSAILRTYTEDVCEMADNGHIMWCESTDPNISKFVNYVLNVMNVDKYLYGWTYCLLKYGDVYLRLYRESDYENDIFGKNKNSEKEEVRNTLNEAVNLNVHNGNDAYSLYVEMIPDPGSMFELVKHGKTCAYVETPNEETGMDYLNNYLSQETNAYNNYRMKSSDVNIYAADDFVHACLEDNFTRFPEKVRIFNDDKDMINGTNSISYSVRRGKSLLYDSYKVWREKSLLENAALLNRVTRSSVIRNIQVEVGNMPKSQIQNTLRRIKDLFEQKTAINTGNSMSETNNPGPIENNIYTAVNNGQGAITYNTLGGDVDVKGLADLDWWNNKFYSSYGIPKQYFGWTDDGAGFNGGSSLTILSSVYAKGVKRVKNAMIQAVTDIVNLILVNKGCKSYINNFVIKMKSPLTQEEIDYRSDLSNRISAISSLQSLFTDVEDRSRRLEILKDLVSTLNYGTNILAVLDDEIISAEEERKKAEEDAAKAEEEEAALRSSEAEAEKSGGNDAAGELPSVDIANEAVASETEKEPLLEEAGENLETIYITEAEDLPTPEELDDSIDFTENK